MPRLFVSETMPWAVLAFGYASIVPLIAAGVFGWRTFEAASGLLRGEERVQIVCLDVAPPPICAPYEGYPALGPNAAGFATGAALVAACWMLAARRRAVWMDGDGTVRVVWGDGWFPVTVRRYPPGSLGACAVTRERRVTLSPIVGTGVTRVGRAPDRWRLRAALGKRLANLGSYATEEEANRMVRLVARAGKGEDDESGVWHYGRVN